MAQPGTPTAHPIGVSLDRKVTGIKETSQPGFAVQVLLTEQQIANEFAAALARGYLDEKFFYWLPNSAQAWVDLCSSTAYRNANRALKLIEGSAHDLAQLWPKAETLCGIGCGEGSKDVPLLAAYSAANRALAYVAADFSQPLLELACAKAQSAGACRVSGVKLDVAADAQLAAAAQLSTEGHRVFSVLGNTLGAFGPTTFPGRLGKIMRHDDRALFDGEIFAGEETLRGYDNPVNRRFAFSPLAGLGLVEGRDGDLVFEINTGKTPNTKAHHKGHQGNMKGTKEIRAEALKTQSGKMEAGEQPARGDGIHEVVKYFVPARDLVLNVAGQEVKLASGKKLLMSGSVKYDEGVIQHLLREGGFRIEFEAKSPDGKFLLVGAAPA
jgi:uncharacterized SAM-dependent methyltransferase